MIHRSAFFLLLCIAAVSATAAHAQSGRLALHEINFDMWCQEEQHLPPARCDKRLPADDAAYQSYVDTIEHYETQKLNQQAHDRRLERNFIQYDPIDNPQQPSVAQPGGQPRQ